MSSPSSPLPPPSAAADPRRSVATVMAPQGRAECVPALLADLAALLPGAERDALVWLAPGHVADLPFAAPAEALPALRRRVGELFGAVPIDVVVQPAAGRRKRLFLADMDSTMIEQECIDELADVVGLKPLVAAITERAMRGEIDFEPALRERVALLRGLPVAVIAEVLERRITLTPGGATLLRTLRRDGIHCSLVSGGFTLFTGPIAARLGFDDHSANALIVESDGAVGAVLSGRVVEPILGRDAKRARLLALRAERGLDAAATMAVGDGANDLAMIEAAGLGVAFHAKPAVAAAAPAKIDHNDLEALLFIQGYAREDFAEVH